MTAIPASVRALLLPGEKLVFGTTLHWIIYWRGLFVTVAGLALSLGARQTVLYVWGEAAAASFARPIAYLVLALTLLGCFLLVMALIRQASVVLIVTDQRVVARFGLIARSTLEMFLSKVEGANIVQSMAGRIFGYGDIVIKGVGENFLPIVDIADPDRFQNALMSQVAKKQTDR